MKKQGFLIAQNKGVNTFFTSSSAYDRPSWIPIQEATVYPTADMAQQALGKLLANGSYSARLVEASAMQFEFPDEGPNKNQEPIIQTDEPPADEMVAGQVDDTDLGDLNLDDDEIEMGNNYDEDDDQLSTEELPYEELPTEDNEQAFLSPIERKLMQGRRPVMPNGNGPVREGFTIPKQKQTNAAPSENKTTVLDLEKPKKVAFKQDTRDDRDTSFSQDVEPLYQEVSVPANVMSALKDSIAMYDKAADFNNGRDDAQASLSLTIVDALRTIEDCLKLGTHEGLKQAQIKITTYMNPITTNFPQEVIDYLYKSGRQPMSLKNAFYDKWDSKRQEKAEKL